MMDGFIVARTERVLHGGFLLFQAPPITKQGHFDVSEEPEEPGMSTALRFSQLITVRVSLPTVHR